MNIPALRTEVLNVLTNTVNLTATEKQKLRNRAVTEYAGAWTDYLAATGQSDTAAVRGAFVAWLTVNKFWNSIYSGGSKRENEATLPAPETME